jgi:hypothetical protein
MLAFLLLVFGVVVAAGALGALAPRAETRTQTQTQLVALIAASGAILAGIGFDRLLGQSLDRAGVGVAPLIWFFFTHPVPISIFLGGITVGLLVLFVRDAWVETPSIETQWGGFGGGLGGWRVSRSIVYLGAAILFAVLLVVASFPKAPSNSQPAPQHSNAGGQKDK